MPAVAIQVLTQQIEHARLHSRHRMNRGAQIKRLQSAPARIPIRKLRAHLGQHRLHVANGLPHDQLARVFQSLFDLLTPWHFANACVACGVGQYQNIARKKCTMRPR
jgi:hypothetical protein